MVTRHLVPRHHKSPQPCQPVTLNVLLVEEVTPPQEGKPIRWLLLTTLPIETFEQQQFQIQNDFAPFQRSVEILRIINSSCCRGFRAVKF